MFYSIQIIKKFFIFNIAFFLSNCQLKIPLKYYPIYNYNNSSPSSIFENFIQQKIYANIEIGTPKQSIEIPLFFNSNDFYISDNPKSQYEPQKFSNLKFYNSNDSITFDDLENGEDFYSYNGELFEMAYYQKDVFYFNNESYEIEFYMPFSYREVNSGGIGMLLLPLSDKTDSTEDKEMTFFEKLKKKGLIKKYYWSIFYNSNKNSKEDEGFLLMGCLPHELFSDLGYYKKGYFNESNRRTVNIAVIEPQIKNIFDMDEIYAYEGNNNILIKDFPSGNSDFRRIELDYNSGGVQAPTNLKEFYNRVFEEYFNNGECFIDTFNKNLNSFYYYKNNKELLLKLKNKFPKINFRSNDLNHNFTLEADDLFIEENNYIFCLLYFINSSNKTWKMGKPFLKKYQFTINYDTKYLSYYYNIYDNEKKEEKQVNNNENPIIIWVITIISIIIILIILFFIFKNYLFEKFFGKKRDYELNEADFVYSSKFGNENHSLNN